MLVTAPENVAWILNIRGYDSEFSPIPNARLLINNKGNIDLFAKLKNNKPEITEFLVGGRILDSVTNEPIQGAEVFLGVNPNPFDIR